MDISKKTEKIIATINRKFRWYKICESMMKFEKARGTSDSYISHLYGVPETAVAVMTKEEINGKA